MKKNDNPANMKDKILFNPEFFEYVSCNLCGADNKQADVVFEADTDKIPKTKEDIMNLYSASSKEIFYERVVRCKKCGLIYISPRPKAKLVVSGYSYAKDEQYVSQEKGRIITFGNCLKIVKKMRGNGRLLDIGAASGIFVKLAADEGYDALGIEPSVWMCELAKRLYNANVLPGTLDDTEFEDDSFDIITMWDVLEHVPDPMATLKKVKRILKPGGFLIVNYPNIADPLAKLFGRKWWFLLSVHLFYFTPETLSSYMKHLGFEKTLHKMHFQVLSYEYLVHRLNEYSKTLAKAAKLPYIIPGFRKLQVPYFASQYLMAGRNKK